MPIFRVKSVKIYTGQKNLHGYTRGSRDKYEVWEDGGSFLPARRDEETGSNSYKDVYAFDNRGAF